VLPANPTSWTFILIWYSHLRLDLPSGPFPSGRRNYLPCRFVLCMTAYWIDIPIDSSTTLMCHLKINRITSIKERGSTSGSWHLILTETFVKCSGLFCRSHAHPSGLLVCATYFYLVSKHA
jgi:hypothetical protein